MVTELITLIMRKIPFFLNNELLGEGGGGGLLQLADAVVPAAAWPCSSFTCMKV